MPPSQLQLLSPPSLSTAVAAFWALPLTCWFSLEPRQQPPQLKVPKGPSGTDLASRVEVRVDKRSSEAEINTCQQVLLGSCRGRGCPGGEYELLGTGGLRGKPGSPSQFSSIGAGHRMNCCLGDPEASTAVTIWIFCPSAGQSRSTRHNAEGLSQSAWGVLAGLGRLGQDGLTRAAERTDREPFRGALSQSCVTPA